MLNPFLSVIPADLPIIRVVDIFLEENQQFNGILEGTRRGTGKWVITTCQPVRSIG